MKELTIESDTDDWPVGTYKIKKSDISNRPDQGTWVELDPRLVSKYNEYKNKLERVAEIAKSDYPDYEMQLGDILKECEFER